MADYLRFGGKRCCGAYWWPMFASYPEQDECTFGPVSNMQYRAYLTDAKQRQRTKWGSFSYTDEEISAELNVRLKDMVDSETSIYKRLAIMHAIFRATGANYLTSDHKHWNPEWRPRKGFHSHYQVDIHRLALFSIYPRQVWLQAVLNDPKDVNEETLKRFGHMYLLASRLWLPDRPPEVYLTSDGDNCPPIPTAEEAARYEQAK